MADDARFQTVPNPSAEGQDIHLQVDVGDESWTGSFTFRQSTTPLGSAPVTNRRSAITLPSPGVGISTFTAVYSGDAQRAAGTTYAVIHRVKQRNDPTATVLAVAPPVSLMLMPSSSPRRSPART